MGHARTACRVRRRKETRHHQGGHRAHNLHRGVQPRLPRGGDGVHGPVGRTHAQNGLLGQYGRPLHHLRQQIHRNPLVASETALRQGATLQRLHHPALLAGRRHGTFDPRAEPAGLLPRREGYHLHGAVQNHPRRAERKTLRRSRRRSLLPGLDHHALDTAVEYRAGRRPRNRIRARQMPQSLYGCPPDCHPGQRTAGVVFYPQDGGQVRNLSGHLQGSGLRRHPLRTAHPLGEACGRCVPRHPGRLRDHLRRYGYRAYRPDVRCRRQPRGPRRRHRPAVYGR